jgi:DNA replication protein DnaC
VEQAIGQAKFPLLKELATFDFAAVQNISQQRVLELAQGGYIAQKETIILIWNSGLRKTHLTTGLAVTACKQGKRVRFLSAGNLVNDFFSAHKDLCLSKFMAQISKLGLLVLGE